MSVELQTYNSILSVNIIDKESENKARAIFDGFKMIGIIQDCSFDDEIWRTTNDTSKISLRFQPNKFCYERFYTKYLGLTYSQFILSLKIYVMFMFGDLVLKTIQTFINEVERIISCNPTELHESDLIVKISMPQRISDFFSVLPGVGAIEKNIQTIMNVMDLVSELQVTNGKARDLASFDSYFKFNDILNDFWKQDLTIEMRLFYYPLYLWWNTTAIIPSRPIEFIVTPRNCLRKAVDGYYLSLRKDRLKGSNNKVTYKLETDFVICEYKIPDKLASEYKKYIELTSEYDSNELKTLFITDTHYSKWRQKKHSNSRYLTYINMGTILRYFYEEIIVGRFNYKVIFERGDGYNNLAENEIQYINLGDTRHLAMINILAEGGTPIVAMALAGHSDIDISMHYAANLSRLIECKVYRQYKKTLSGEKSYQIEWDKKKPIVTSEYVFLQDRSRCYSENYSKGCFSDCEKVIGDNGEIGDCRKCMYHRAAEMDKFYSSENDEFLKKIIEEDCHNLSEIIKLVRTEKGYPEDITQAMLRLQNSSQNYATYCKEKLKRGEQKNG